MNNFNDKNFPLSFYFNKITKQENNFFLYHLLISRSLYSFKKEPKKKEITFRCTFPLFGLHRKDESTYTREIIFLKSKGLRQKIGNNFLFWCLPLLIQHPNNLLINLAFFLSLYSFMIHFLLSIFYSPLI